MIKFLGVLVISLLALGASAFGSNDPYQDIFQSVNQSQLQFLLKNLTGVNSVNVGGQTFSITDRYAPSSKQKFRAYWTAYYEALGMTVNPFSYQTRHKNGEAEGHNLEAILPGASPDSVVIIVHYDSIGKRGHETENPGVDDDMSGMAVQMETARILTNYHGRLKYTVRFVAADYEEWAGPGLEGARQYAKYVKQLSQQQGFKLVAAVDDEQVGWNCARDGLCGDNSQGNVLDLFSCSPTRRYNYKALGDSFEALVARYSPMKINRACMGGNSDHYAMWEIGVPAVVFSEHNPFANPHFDAEGGDTYDKIDQDYFFKIAQIGVSFSASLVGIN